MTSGNVSARHDDRGDRRDEGRWPSSGSPIVAKGSPGRLDMVRFGNRISTREQAAGRSPRSPQPIRASWPAWWHPVQRPGSGISNVLVKPRRSPGLTVGARPRPSADWSGSGRDFYCEGPCGDLPPCARRPPLTLGFGFGSQLLTYAVTFNNHSVAAGPDHRGDGLDACSRRRGSVPPASRFGPGCWRRSRRRSTSRPAG